MQRATVGSSVWMGLARLTRPANLFTAHADILAGFAAAGSSDPTKAVLLLIATTGLYGGGIVFNDVFDAELDRSERPERPIPNRSVPVSLAIAWGSILLVCGIVAAWASSPASGSIALAIAASALLYDSISKRSSLWGPLNMGLCRGLNLLLGISAAPAMLGGRWPAAAVTFCYIVAITSLSRGEVHGGEKATRSRVLAMLGAASLAMGALFTMEGFHRGWGLLFLGVFIYRVAGPFSRALRTLDAMAIRTAIRTGVLSLILLDAVIASGFKGPWYGLAVVLLNGPALLLAKVFAVT
jgi:4-hydroxybenzoate polyprenyltransferase